jgi:hypothetical protein
MVVMMIMLVGMRVRHPVVRMFVAVLCAGKRWIRMRVVMVPVVMSMRVRMLCHRFLPIP